MSTFIEWYAAGGPTMSVIAVLALVGLGVILDRVYVLLILGRPNSRALIERVIQLVRADQVDDAIKLCSVSRAALTDIGLLILRSRTIDPADLLAVVTAAALSVVPRLRRRLDYIQVFGNVAVLAGLLGLAAGLEQTFAADAVATTVRTETVMLGASRALHPCELGFAVAAVLWIAHAYLASQATRSVEQIEEFSARLIDALNGRPDVRLGHR